MELCPRCLGGEIYAPNCLSCGGCGWVDESTPLQSKQPQTTPTIRYKKPANPNKRGKKAIKRRPDTTSQPSVKHPNVDASSKMTHPNSASIAESRAARIRETQKRREAEKSRRVKVFKVKLSPEEQHREKLHKERQNEAKEKRRKAAEARHNNLKRREQIQKTHNGTIASLAPLPKKNCKATKLAEQKHSQKKPASGSPTGDVRVSKWATPEHSKARREKLERRLGLHEEMAQRRVSREERSANQITNNQIQEQLTNLLHTTKKSTTSLRTEGKTPAKKEKQRDNQNLYPFKSSSLHKRKKRKASSARSEVLDSGRRSGRNSDFFEGGISDWERYSDRGTLSAIDLTEEDGGKHIGQSFRDFDGSFGSMPLYDDYDN